MLFTHYQSIASNVHTKISGKAPSALEGQIVELQLYNELLISENKDYQQFSTMIRDGKWAFSLPIFDGLRYMSIQIIEKNNKKLHRRISYFLVKNGMKINCLDGDLNKFEGTDADYWTLQESLSRANYAQEKLSPANNKQKLNSAINNNEKRLNSKHRILESYSDKIDNDFFLKLKLDIELEYYIQNVQELFYIKENQTSLVEDTWRQMTQAMGDLESKPDRFYYSRFSAPFFISKYKADSCYAVQKPFDRIRCYTYLKKESDKKFRDLYLTYFLINYNTNSQDLRKEVDDGLLTVENPILKKTLEEKFASHRPGPMFSMTDDKGKLVNLSDFREKYVLLDFWYTGCSGCKIVNSKFKEILSVLEAKNIVFISINIDKSMDKWRKSLEDGYYTHEKSINLNTEGLGSNHPIIKMYEVQSYPTLVLLDQKGIIVNEPIDPRYDNGKRLLSLLK